MYCVKCGKQIHDQAVVCPHCGCATGNPFPNQQQQPTAGNPFDAPSVGYAILGFFIPIVGLILYLVWNAEFPKRAKSAGKGALISVIVSVVMVVIYYIVIFFLLLSSLSCALSVFLL